MRYLTDKFAFVTGAGAGIGRAVAAEWSRRVNAICPGSTRTPRIESYWRKTRKRGEPACPMKCYAEPGKIARPAVFLASPDASCVTGAVLVADGGLTAGFRIPAFDQM